MNRAQRSVREKQICMKTNADKLNRVVDGKTLTQHINITHTYTCYMEWVQLMSDDVCYRISQWSM